MKWDPPLNLLAMGMDKETQRLLPGAFFTAISITIMGLALSGTQEVVALDAM